jgi:DNA invertase Pin-like site-specific DNA recombinase
MRIGYARVSTHEQNMDLQLDALKRAGCERVFRDIISGAKAERPGWEQAKAALREGDTLVVWRLDRLGRSLGHLIKVVSDLSESNIGFYSLTESIDTTTNGGRLIFHIFGALAEFERELIRERTLAGLTSARQRGRKGGRPKVLSAKAISKARLLLSDHSHSATEVAKDLGVSRATLYRALKEPG